MKYFYLIFIGFFISSCAKPYTQNEIAQDVKIEDFKNSYELKAERTDSIFDIFNDNELQELIKIALNNNNDIFIYNNRIKIAKSQIKIATSKQMPNLNLSSSYQFNKDSSLNANLMASWELDIYGKYANLKNAQEEIHNIAKNNLDLFKISLISDVSLAYFNIKYLATNIILTKERIKNYYDLMDIVDSMYDNGFIDFSTYLDNKNTLRQEEQNLDALLNTYEENKNKLKFLINNKDYDFKDEIYNFYIPRFHVNLDNSVNIILNRPDIRAQISNLNVAVYNLNSVKTSLYPSINLNGSLSKTLLSPMGAGELAYQILASLTLPIFSRSEIYENIKISDYTRLEAYYTLQKYIHTALNEIENAIYALETNKKKLLNSTEILKDNEEILKTIKESNKLGLIDFSEYIKAINNNISMIKDNNMAYFNTISATIYLYRSIGGNTNDITQNDKNEIEAKN